MDLGYLENVDLKVGYFGTFKGSLPTCACVVPSPLPIATTLEMSEYLAFFC